MHPAAALEDAPGQRIEHVVVAAKRREDATRVPIEPSRDASSVAHPELVDPASGGGEQDPVELRGKRLRGLQHPRLAPPQVHLTSQLAQSEAIRHHDALGRGSWQPVAIETALVEKHANALQRSAVAELSLDLGEPCAPALDGYGRETLPTQALGGFRDGPTEAAGVRDLLVPGATQGEIEADTGLRPPARQAHQIPVCRPAHFPEH